MSSRVTQYRLSAGGFSLIELLVVILIISALISLLLPALGNAQRNARLVMCSNQSHQLATAIQNYSIDHDGQLPRGPETVFDGSITWDRIASRQLYIAAESAWNGGGPLVTGRYLGAGDSFFCPGDNSTTPVTEQPKLASGTDPTTDTFGSYLFRQLDQTTRSNNDDMGDNDAGEKARALLLDMNRDEAGNRRLNHLGRDVNVAYLDGHVDTAPNTMGWFNLRASDTVSNAAIELRWNQVLVTADYVEVNGDPAEAPLP